MSNKTFFFIFVSLHVVLAGAGLVVAFKYGLFATLFLVLGGVVLLQGWLAERRKLRRRR